MSDILATLRHRALDRVKGAAVILREHKKFVTLVIVHGASQRDLAAAAGWSSHSYVGRLIRGQAVGVTPRAAVGLAEFFGVKVEDLFDP